MIRNTTACRLSNLFHSSVSVQLYPVFQENSFVTDPRLTTRRAVELGFTSPQVQRAMTGCGSGSSRTRTSIAACRTESKSALERVKLIVLPPASAVSVPRYVSLCLPHPSWYEKANKGCPVKPTPEWVSMSPKKKRTRRNDIRRSLEPPLRRGTR